MSNDEYQRFEQQLRRMATGKDRDTQAYNALRRDQHVELPQVTVMLTVRHPSGGNVEYFTYTERTVSTLLAECDARKAAREAGWVVWAHISTEVGDGQ